MRDIDLDRDVEWIPGVGQMIRGGWFDSRFPEGAPKDEPQPASLDG